MRVEKFCLCLFGLIVRHALIDVIVVCLWSVRNTYCFSFYIDRVVDTSMRAGINLGLILVVRILSMVPPWVNTWIQRVIVSLSHHHHDISSIWSPSIFQNIRYHSHVLCGPWTQKSMLPLHLSHSLSITRTINNEVRSSFLSISPGWQVWIYLIQNLAWISCIIKSCSYVFSLICWVLIRT